MVRRHLLTPFLALVFLLGSLPSHAIMQGISIQRKPEHPVVTLKIKMNTEATKCTGTFVSPNTILTAAHCFDHIVSSCRNQAGCQRTAYKSVFELNPKKQSTLWINNKRVTKKYRVLRHSKYKSASETGYDQYKTTNEDVALIILSQPSRNQGYVSVSKSKVPPGTTAWVYGAGMTEVQLYNNPDTGEAYNIEANAGKMKKQKLKIFSPIRNGLIKIPSRLVGKKVSPNLYDLSVAKGLQVLSADSGGPLIRNRILHGITRNFVFTFSSVRRPASKENNFEIAGRSIFTSLATKSQQSFLRRAKKFGGAVTFAD